MVHTSPSNASTIQVIGRGVPGIEGKRQLQAAIDFFSPYVFTPVQRLETLLDPFGHKFLQANEMLTGSTPGCPGALAKRSPLISESFRSKLLHSHTTNTTTTTVVPQKKTF